MPELGQIIAPEQGGGQGKKLWKVWWGGWVSNALKMKKIPHMKKFFPLQFFSHFTDFTSENVAFK